MSLRRLLGCALLLALIVTGCVVARVPVAEPLTPLEGAVVRSAVKAHMTNGTIVLFRRGITVRGDSAVGSGTRYSAALVELGTVGGVALQDVVGMESFSLRSSPGKSVALSLATGAALAGMKVVFGSCPTIYADSAGSAVLQAESFSYSIAPLLAKRDVDRLQVTADAAGVVRLEVRNEALETHFIDQMELLEVSHGADETVYPAPFGAPLAMRAMKPARVSDRAGRELGATLAAADSLVFATAPATLARASGEDPWDWIDVVLPAPAGADSVALLLRMRGSLLTTLLFYDYMLQQPGARALDWLAEDLSRITTLVRFGHWYANNLGLKVEVLQHGRYRQLARLADFGPIAYRHVAVPVPVQGDSVRIRLRFLADQWRVDQLAVAGEFRRVRARPVPVARVIGRAGAMEPAHAAALRRSDDTHLTTVPGDRFHIEYDAGATAQPRTFLFAAHGYYAEWVRGAWLREARADAAPFRPGPRTVPDLLRDWRLGKDSLEAQFFRYRVPVS